MAAAGELTAFDKAKYPIDTNVSILALVRQNRIS